MLRDEDCGRFSYKEVSSNLFEMESPSEGRSHLQGGVHQLHGVCYLFACLINILNYCSTCSQIHIQLTLLLVLCPVQAQGVFISIQHGEVAMKRRVFISKSDKLQQPLHHVFPESLFNFLNTEVVTIDFAPISSLFDVFMLY